MLLLLFVLVVLIILQLLLHETVLSPLVDDFNVGMDEEVCKSKIFFNGIHSLSLFNEEDFIGAVIDLNVVDDAADDDDAVGDVLNDVKRLICGRENFTW